jgi:hypothetical protein
MAFQYPTGQSPLLVISGLDGKAIPNTLNQYVCYFHLSAAWPASINSRGAFYNKFFMYSFNKYIRDTFYYSDIVLGSVQTRKSLSTSIVYISSIDDKQPNKQQTVSDSDEDCKQNKNEYLTRTKRGWLKSVSTQEWCHYRVHVKFGLSIDVGLELSSEPFLAQRRH